MSPNWFSKDVPQLTAEMEAYAPKGEKEDLNPLRPLALEVKKKLSGKEGKMI